MASPVPLSGIELIDCAAASTQDSIEVVAKNCGYGNDIAAFERELQQAGRAMGMEIASFQDLVAIRQANKPQTPPQF